MLERAKSGRQHSWGRRRGRAVRRIVGTPLPRDPGEVHSEQAQNKIAFGGRKKTRFATFLVNQRYISFVKNDKQGFLATNCDTNRDIRASVFFSIICSTCVCFRRRHHDPRKFQGICFCHDPRGIMFSFDCNEPNAGRRHHRRQCRPVGLRFGAGYPQSFADDEAPAVQQFALLCVCACVTPTISSLCDQFFVSYKRNTFCSLFHPHR